MSGVFTDEEIVASIRATQDAANTAQLEIRLVAAKAEVEAIETRLAELKPKAEAPKVEVKPEPKVEVKSPTAKKHPAKKVDKLGKAS